MRAIEITIIEEMTDLSYTHQIGIYTTTILVGKIVAVISKIDYVIITTVDGNWYKTKEPYELIREKIAACYGAEDEED